MDELLESVEAARRDLSTIRGVATITQDRAVLGQAWKDYAQRRAPGSIEYLSSDQRGSKRARLSKQRGDGETGLDPQPFLDQLLVTPTRVISSFERALPDKWRVMSRVDGSAEIILVISGARWWTTASSAGDAARGEHVPILHASIATMLDPSDLFRRLIMSFEGGRDASSPRCTRLRGTPRHRDDLPVWPGETYRLCLDERHGVVLDLAAFVGTARAAGTVFSEVEFNASLEGDTFALDPNAGVLWHQLAD